jgi:hypothetical protein
MSVRLSAKETPGMSPFPRRWLKATESALSRNASTLAVMQNDSLLDPNGYLQKLRERGYSVEEPDVP